MFWIENHSFLFNSCAIALLPTGYKTAVDQHFLPLPCDLQALRWTTQNFMDNAIYFLHLNHTMTISQLKHRSLHYKYHCIWDTKIQRSFKALSHNLLTSSRNFATQFKICLATVYFRQFRTSQFELTLHLIVCSITYIDVIYPISKTSRLIVS